MFGTFPCGTWQNGRPSKNEAIWVPGKQVGRGDTRKGGGGLRCKGFWGEIRGKTSQLTSLLPHGFQPLIPTCVCNGSIGLQRQNMIMERDFDFHYCRLKEFHILDNHKQCCQNSQKTVGFFFFIISCQERKGHKQIFLYFERDVLFYNILKERKQTSLANAF